MEVAVVYYSLQGNAALAAKALAEKLGARLLELKETAPRSLGPGGFMKAGFQAMLGLKSKLQGQPWQDVTGCSELYLLSPVWASKAAPAMNRFLANCDFAGKAVSIYTVQADPVTDYVKARQAMASQVQRKGGTVKASHGLVGAGPGKGVKDALAREVCELIS